MRIIAPTKAWSFTFLLAIGTLLPQTAYAQQVPSTERQPTGQGPASGSRDPFNPAFGNPIYGRPRPDDRGRPDDREGSNPLLSTGPIGPVERATLPPNSDSTIALVPFALRQTTLPPMWLRVCRTNSANGAGAMWVSADGESARMAYPRCVYVAFKDKVTIGTTTGDEATVEYQFLGRY